MKLGVYHALRERKRMSEKKFSFSWLSKKEIYPERKRKERRNRERECVCLRHEWCSSPSYVKGKTQGPLAVHFNSKHRVSSISCPNSRNLCAEYIPTLNVYGILLDNFLFVCFYSCLNPIKGQEIHFYYSIIVCPRCLVQIHTATC